MRALLSPNLIKCAEQSEMEEKEKQPKEGDAPSSEGSSGTEGADGADDSTSAHSEASASTGERLRSMEDLERELGDAHVTVQTDSELLAKLLLLV